LLVALRSFLLTCAIRDIRATEGAPDRGGPIHRSMLVNVSRFTAVQDNVADAIHVSLEDIRRSVRLHGALPPEQAAAHSPEITRLATVFTSDFSSCGLLWSQVLAALHDAIAPIRVQAVNQRTGAASLDYGITDKYPGVRVIAVGGNSLSRGLTLEGLSTSYFRRDPRAYDTLLQMGRWFGYRDGYLDLCRVWLTEEAEGWYKHVTRATGELKRDFARMKRMKATPREFGLRVRTHPDTVLLITARNKMSTGMDVDQVWDVSLMGRMIESARLYSDKKRNESNFDQLLRFLERLGSRNGPEGNAVVWRQVPAETVADLLEAFLIHPLNFDFQGDSIATFLRDITARGPLLSEWTIALPIAGEGRPISLSALPQIQVKATQRKVKLSYGGSLLISGKSARVGSRSDLRHALSAQQFRQLTKAPEDDLRAAMAGPLMVIYLVRGYETDEQVPYRDDLVLPALGLHFPGTKDQDQSKNLVRYRLNRVAQRELMPDDLDEDDLDDNDPDD